MIVVSSEFQEDYPVLDSHTEVTPELEERAVSVPKLKRTVLLREFDGGEQNEYRKPMYKINGTKIELSMEEVNLRLLAIGMRRRDGSRMYPSTDSGIKLLKKWPASIVEFLAKHMRELNGEDEDDATVEGNSEGERTSELSSDSPSLSVASPPSSDAE
jgi:hypothetical protein